MKKFLVALAIAALLAVGVAQVASAGTPPSGGDGAKNCIGWCLSHWSPPAFTPGTVDEFAIMHTNGTGCGMMHGNTISEASPPQPQP